MLCNTDVVCSFADSAAFAVLWEAGDNMGDCEVLIGNSHHLSMDSYQEAQITKNDSKQTENDIDKFTFTLTVLPSYLFLNMSSLKVVKLQGRLNNNKRLVKVILVK